MKKLTIFLVSLAALITAIFGGYRAEQAHVTFIAHRGASFRYLDNSIEAFEGAAKRGFGGIETDVRVTADGVLVCSHGDDAVLRDGTELEIASHTYAELTAKPLRNPNSFRTLYLCTFEDYLDVCARNNMICFIEFKGMFTEESIRKTFSLVQERYDLARCPLQSFEIENLRLAKRLFPDLPVMLTCGEWNADMEAALQEGYSIDMEYSELTPEIVKQFHDAGLEVGAWTANTHAAISYCLRLGVDYIESDVFSR